MTTFIKIRKKFDQYETISDSMKIHKQMKFEES